jgi:hypothetical protein
LKGILQEQIFASKYFSLPIKFTTIVARPLDLQGKLFPILYKSEKYTEFKMEPNIQFRKICKNVHLKFEVIRYVMWYIIWYVIWYIIWYVMWYIMRYVMG